MSQGNIQLGIAGLCGGATYLLTNVAALNPSVGIALAIAVAGIVLIALGSKTPAPVEEVAAAVKQRAKKEVKKLPSPQKVAQKAQKVVQKAVQKVQKTLKEVEPKEDDSDVPETPDKKKSKKKKKSGGTPTSPASPQPKPKSTPKVEEDSKEKSKAQLRKLKKKEAEEKQKVEDEKQRAAELARKAAEQKRETAQQKKLQAKARKASQKAAQPQETKVETKQPVSHAPEEGWEVQSSRKSRGIKDGKDSKEPIVIDVKIPRRQHALIIGKQGEGLKKLTEDLDVIITMPKRDSGDDLVLIKGLPKDVYTAKKALEEIATQGYSTVTQPGWVTKQAQLQSKGQLALVFGEKGTTLQSIAKATKTRLQMPEKGTKDFKISVTGDGQHVDQALTLIQELLDQGYTKTTHPDWIQEEVQIGDPAILGAIIGPKGVTVQKISRENKVKIDTPSKVADPSQKQDVVFIRGPKKNVAKAKQAILGIVASREPAIEQEIPDPAWQGEVEEVAW